MRDIREIYERLGNGDSVTTPELELFVEHMNKLEKLLIALGPEFRIVRTHVTLQKSAAESFLFHRSLPR